MAPFNYNFTPNPRISDVFNSMRPKTTTPMTLSPGGSPFSPVTRTLPNGAGTYQSPVTWQPQAPVVQTPQAPVVQTPQAPVVQTPQAPQAPVTPTPQGLDYSKYTDPMTGKVMSPQEYANHLAQKVTGGSVPGYAGDALTQGPQTTQQLTSTATDLTNQRNDIATGESDPYNAGSKSGIAYSPTDLAAIEKAYAGIYDPALKDVFAKLDLKQKEDASALTSKNKLAEMAQQHKYDVALKGTPTAAEASAGLNGGTYVLGANPTADAFISGIQNGTYKTSDVPKEYKGLVAQGMASQGNQSSGKPTTTEVGLQTLDAARRLKIMFDAKEGTSVVGKSRLFGGGFATPGSDSANFKNLFETLIANKSLEGIKFLKGQGSVSDAERLTLKAAMSELNLSQSEGEFSKSLQRIIDKLEGNVTSSDSSSNILRDPTGTQEVNISDLTPEELKEAQDAGWVSFNSVGGDTKQASNKGIVLGYDINSYATDPTHETKITNIVNKMGNIATSTEAQSYINTVASNSPVSGLDVMSASTAYGVPPALILAMMQQDSSFGTKGKAVRTKNPGNVGNTDSGASVFHGSWREGVFAVARNLSKRKTT